MHRPFSKGLTKKEVLEKFKSSKWRDELAKLKAE
jgi:hypothetical protein